MEHNRPLVSVIIPVYNRQEYIEECIRSVCGQTYQNFQIVLIDDGSTDQTLSLCQAMAARESRIVLLQGQHGGVSAARNLGLDHATGDYLFFVDSDDVIHPQLIEALVSALENTGAQVGGTMVQNVPYNQWDKVPALIQKSPDPAQTTFQDHKQTMDMVFMQTTPLGNIGGVMLRRNWVGDTRFRTDLTVGEDFYFIYQNLIKGASSVFLKQRWYYCRIHKNNTSNSFDFQGFWTRFLRRQLVWESELSFGRVAHANRQKSSVWGFYIKFLRTGRMTKAERKRMCRLMRTHRKALSTCLSTKDKLVYYLALYLPDVYVWIYRLRHKNEDRNSIWT